MVVVIIVACKFLVQCHRNMTKERWYTGREKNKQTRGGSRLEFLFPKHTHTLCLPTRLVLFTNQTFAYVTQDIRYNIQAQLHYTSCSNSNNNNSANGKRLCWIHDINPFHSTIVSLIYQSSIRREVSSYIPTATSTTYDRLPCKYPVRVCARGRQTERPMGVPEWDITTIQFVM